METLNELNCDYEWEELVRFQIIMIVKNFLNISIELLDPLLSQPNETRVTT